MEKDRQEKFLHAECARESNDSAFVFYLHIYHTRQRIGFEWDDVESQAKTKSIS